TRPGKTISRRRPRLSRRLRIALPREWNQAFGESELFEQAPGVERRFDFHVIVEVAIHVATGALGRRRGRDTLGVLRLGTRTPRADARRPTIECRFGVTAGIQF